MAKSILDLFAKINELENRINFLEQNQYHFESGYIDMKSGHNKQKLNEAIQSFNDKKLNKNIISDGINIEYEIKFDKEFSIPPKVFINIIGLGNFPNFQENNLLFNISKRLNISNEQYSGLKISVNNINTKGFNVIFSTSFIEAMFCTKAEWFAYEKIELNDLLTI